MAAYNTGPFDSDAAQDLLQLYRDLTAEERLANLRAVFADGLRHPDGSSTAIEEVVAGAALVALALPGGNRVREIPQMAFEKEIAAAAVRAPGLELIRLALDALRGVVTDGQWFAQWISDADQVNSRRTVDVLISVLADHLAGGA